MTLNTRHNDQTGFTLIEAIVALVVFTMTILAVYAWVNTNLTALIKVENVTLQEPLLKKVMQKLQEEELHKKKSGTYLWQDYTVEWHAELIEPIKQGKTARGSQGLYDHGLYTIALDVFKQTSLVSNYKLRLVNYQKVRSLEFE